MSANSYFARIAIARKALGLAGKPGSGPDRKYRGILVEKFAVDTSTALNTDQLEELIKVFEGMGWRAFGKTTPTVAVRKFVEFSAENKAMGSKIGAMLKEQSRPWNYAHALALTMFKVQRIEWLKPAQLHSVVAALAVDQARSRKAGKAGAA